MCGIPWGVFRQSCVLVRAQRLTQQRLSRLRTLVKSFRPSSDHTSLHMFACAGEVVFSFLPVFNEQS